MNMLRTVVWLQWKSAWPWIIASLVAVIALPVASAGIAWPTDPDQLAFFLAKLDLWSWLYPTLAGVLGVAFAVLTWQADRRGHFVYALSLPLPRWRYVLLRYGATAVWVAVVATALWVAAVGVTSLIAIPETLSVHPHRLAAKFQLAALAVFTAAFAIGAMPEKTRRIGIRFALAVAAVELVMVLLDQEFRFLTPLVRALAGPTGPFAALGGRWMLIDA